LAPALQQQGVVVRAFELAANELVYSLDLGPSIAVATRA
jgi:hypothetical protein